MKHLEWALNLIRELCESGYTGKLEINCFKGGITNVNKVESLKPQPEQGG